MVAARKGDEELAALLISARANLDLVGRQGITPLHMAVRARKDNVVKLLIQAGCDTSIKANGKTAGELARTNGAAIIAKLLGTEQADGCVNVAGLDEKRMQELRLQ